jgi:transcriptional regulator with XRE-family HTH domain
MPDHPLGPYLKELRLARGLSMRGLGKKVGVSAPHIGDIEKGHRQPSEPLLSLLAEALETDLDDVLSHSRRPPVKQMKELIALDPQYGPALRKLVEAVLAQNITPQEIHAITEGLGATA